MVHNTCDILNWQLFNFDKLTDKNKRNIFGDGSQPASELDVINPLNTYAKNQSEWDLVMNALSPGGSAASNNFNVRVETLEDALALANDMGRPFNNLLDANDSVEDIITDPRFLYGNQSGNTGSRIEIHPNEASSTNAPNNNLPHIKWIDNASGEHGHIFYGSPDSKWSVPGLE